MLIELLGHHVRNFIFITITLLKDYFYYYRELLKFDRFLSLENQQILQTMKTIHESHLLILQVVKQSQVHPRVALVEEIKAAQTNLLLNIVVHLLQNR